MSESGRLPTIPEKQEDSKKDHTDPTEKLVEMLPALSLKPSPDGRKNVDLFSEPAMNNAVNICHNIQVKSSSL